MSLIGKIKNNLETINNQLSDSCQLIAVSKYVTSDEIKIAYDCGQRDFGENRVPDLLKKSEKLKETCPEIRWHMIGNIQSNKIKSLLTVHNLYAVHSIYEKKHLEIFNKETKTALRIFFQVNSSNEKQKGGVSSYEEIIDLARAVNNKSLIIEGLMGMGKLDGSEQELFNSFCELKNMSNQLGDELRKTLKTSMGMSGDFKLAVKAGSDFVRIGSAVFKS